MPNYSFAMQINTLKWMFLLNVALFSLIVVISLLCFHGADRVKVVGWFNMTFSVSVFAAPLSIIVRSTHLFILTIGLFFLLMRNHL